MDGGKAKHHARKVSLVEAGNTAKTRREESQGVGNVLQGGGTSNITVRFGDLGPFGENGEEGRRITHRFSQSYHSEARSAGSRQDMGDTRDNSSAGSGWDTVGNDLYTEMTGNRGKVGDVATDIRSVCRGERLRGECTQGGGLGGANRLHSHLPWPRALQHLHPFPLFHSGHVTPTGERRPQQHPPHRPLAQ